MRFRFILLSLILVSAMISQTRAQRVCGTMEHLDFQKLDDPKLENRMRAVESHTQAYLANPGRAVNGVVTIPVVVHVVYNTSSENISDAQIQSQITVLNDDFRRMNADASNTPSLFSGVASDAEIEFCMATVDPSGNSTNGITRTSTSVSAFSTNDNMKFNSSGGKDAWPASDYLNIWVCDISGGILGYAQFPGGSPSTDGVVIDYQYFGTTGTATAPFDLGRTATHEVGHWLNLRHIWGDGGCSVDDFVGDTPLAGSPNYTGAPCSFPGPNTCNSGSGDQPDMFQNYMDYSDDVCMNLFTTGQKTRMRALFDTGGFRASLLSSNKCGTPPPPTCSDGIQNGDETGVDCGGSICPPCQSGCSDNPATLTLVLDNYPEETSWVITNAGGTTVASSGGTYAGSPDGSTVVVDLCLVDGCYDFTISDAYGDGICCSYGAGSYTLTDASGVLASGGAFGASETTNFCLNATGPTCTDGIQNGDETGVDCGGSVCPACPTCFDGIQNGDETGVDCGGASCPACPTCFDGIQNGDETGVDCGGASCPPCSGGCTYVTINSENFDSNWGIWTDGGSDCRRSINDAAFANSGNYCVRLRDNTSSSTTSTGNLNLTAYSELTVAFSYITSSMDNANEDFWLQISTNGGSSYSTVEEWNLNDEFVNNVRYNDAVVISGPFSTNTRLRFRCDASTNSDWVYIDDVVISGCSGTARQDEQINVEDLLSNDAEPQSEAGKFAASLEMSVFPNPTEDLLTVAYTLTEPVLVSIRVTDLTGKLVQAQTIQGEIGRQKTRVDAGNLSPGIYFVNLSTPTGSISRKFVVAR